MDTEFEGQKSSYFVGLALQVREALTLHHEYGLTKEDGWRNVTEHCLVEVARVQMLGWMLDLHKETIDKLMMAAALHDFYKRYEVQLIKTRGIDWVVYNISSAQSEQILYDKGFDPEVIRLACAVGHESILEAEEILARGQFTEMEVAYLIMHYIDDYTINDEWAEFDGLIKRMDHNETNSRYQKLDSDGLGKFREGETTFMAHRRVGLAAEDALSNMLRRIGWELQVNGELPVLVDYLIKVKIKGGL